MRVWKGLLAVLLILLLSLPAYAESYAVEIGNGIFDRVTMDDGKIVIDVSMPDAETAKELLKGTMDSMLAALVTGINAGGEIVNDIIVNYQNGECIEFDCDSLIRQLLTELNTVQEEIMQAGEKIGESYREFKRSASDSIKEGTKDAIREAFQQVSADLELLYDEFAVYMEEWMRSSEEQLGKTMEAAGKKVGDAMNAAGEKIGDAIDSAGEKIGNAVDTVGDTVTDLYEDASNLADELGGKLSDLISGFFG